MTVEFDPVLGYVDPVTVTLFLSRVYIDCREYLGGFLRLIEREGLNFDVAAGTADPPCRHPRDDGAVRRSHVATRLSLGKRALCLPERGTAGDGGHRYSSGCSEYVASGGHRSAVSV